ncbi:restriction endonuclease subunit S [Geotalea toluenoxydans]
MSSNNPCQSVIQTGYKKTEVGVIPEDWEVKTAAQICELVVDCKNRTAPVVDGGEFAVVRTPNVRNGKFVREELRFTNETSFHEWTARAIPQLGDVLITREAPLGEVCLVPSDVRVCLGQRMMLYRPDREKTESSFLLYALMSSGVQSNLFKKIGGSTVGHAKVDDIRYLQIPLPPTKAEQETIAEALSDTDALIESLEQLIAKKRNIKQGAMQELLTGKKRLPEFTSVGARRTVPLQCDKHHQIPDGWEVKRLGDVLKVRHGKSQHNVVVVGGKYPILASGGEIGRTNEYLYDKPSILIGRKGTIDVPQFIDTPFWTIDTLFFTEIASEADAKFIFYKFNTINWRSYNEASGVPSLSASRIENIDFSCPPLPEQTAIATILFDMDAEITTLETRLAKTRQLKQGMMHNLLTGKIRLNHDFLD